MAPASNDDKAKPDVKGKQANPKVTKKAAKKKAAKKTTAKKKVAKKQAARKTAQSKAVPQRRASDKNVKHISARERYERIAKMAYFRAEKRNFEPGWEQRDWLESEKIIDQMLDQVREED